MRVRQKLRVSSSARSLPEKLAIALEPLRGSGYGLPTVNPIEHGTGVAYWTQASLPCGHVRTDVLRSDNERYVRVSGMNNEHIEEFFEIDAAVASIITFVKETFHKREQFIRAIEPVTLERILEPTYRFPETGLDPNSQWSIGERLLAQNLIAGKTPRVFPTRRFHPELLGRASCLCSKYATSSSVQDA